MTTAFLLLLAYLLGTCTVSAAWLWIERCDAIAAGLTLGKPGECGVGQDRADSPQGK